MSESNGKKARFAPGSANDNTDSYEYHWFVTNAHGWAANDSLPLALARLAKLTSANFFFKLPINVWRIPGRDEGTHYSVEFYTPQIEGAALVGTTMPTNDYLMTDNGPVPMNPEPPEAA